MREFISSVGGEFSKLIIRKKYIVLIILSALICFLRLGGELLVMTVSGGELAVKSNYIIAMLGFSTDILVPLIVFMAVTDLFASEIQEDSFKASLMRPLTRFKVMSSKSLAAFMFGAAVMLIMFLVCTVMQLISGSGLSDIPQGLLIYVIDIIPVLAIVAMAVFINMISKSPTLAMLLCIAVYVFFKYLNIYVSPLGQMVFTAYSQWHRIWIGAQLPFGALASRVGIWFGSVLILYTASYIIFEKKDF